MDTTSSSVPIKSLIIVLPSLSAFIRYVYSKRHHLKLLLLFLPSRVATLDFPSPFVSVFCIILRHFNHCHVLTYRILIPNIWPSRFPSAVLSSASFSQYTHNLSSVHVQTISVLPLEFFSPNRPTCAVPLMYSFLILSILVPPNENRYIFNSAALCLFVSATVSNPYNISNKLSYCCSNCDISR